MLLLLPFFLIFTKCNDSDKTSPRMNWFFLMINALFSQRNLELIARDSSNDCSILISNFSMVNGFLTKPYDIKQWLITRYDVKHHKVVL